MTLTTRLGLDHQDRNPGDDNIYPPPKQPVRTSIEVWKRLTILPPLSPPSLTPHSREFRVCLYHGGMMTSVVSTTVKERETGPLPFKSHWTTMTLVGHQVRSRTTVDDRRHHRQRVYHGIRPEGVTTVRHRRIQNSPSNTLYVVLEGETSLR